MKSNVKLSTWSMFLTTFIITLLTVLIIITFVKHENAVAWSLVGVIVILYVLTLCYTPMAVTLKDGKLVIHKPLRNKTINVDDIESVKLCPPTMAERRIIGSGGFGGYWGWFSERDMGKYFAYYGKSSDCFLVRLKSGRQYMIGCTEPKRLVTALNDAIRA